MVKLKFNYIRITYTNTQPIHDTWKHNISLERLVKLICNYLVKMGSGPYALTFDSTYGLRVDMQMKYLWSRTASEVIITTGSDKSFGIPFSEEVAEMIKQKVLEYWNSKHFTIIREKVKKRDRIREKEILKEIRR